MHNARIGKWQLVEDASLRAGDEVHSLTPKGHDLIMYLADHPGMLVTNDELIEALWSHQFVSDGSIYKLVSQLRRALGDDPRSPTYIKTVSRRGYILIAEVTRDELVDEITQPVVTGSLGDDESRFQQPDLEQPGPATVATVRSIRSWLGVVGFIVLLAGALLWWSGLPAWDETTGEADGIVILVLPFENMNSSEADRYFPLGVYNDELIKISKLPDVKVIGRTTAMRFGSGMEDVTTDVGATHIVTGNVRRNSDGLHINVELASVDDGTLLWSESFDEPIGKLFQVQDKIVAGIASALNIPQTESSPEQLTDLDAYNLFVEARTLLNSPSPSNIRMAVGRLQQAIEINPEYAMAYSQAAIALRLSDEADPTRLAEARHYAEQAIAFDKDAAESRFAMALVTTGDEALSHFAASIARNPNDSRVRLLYGNALMGMGHNIAAWHQWQAALQLDPLPPETHLSFVKALPGLGRGEEVESHVRRALELEPDNPTTLLEVGDHRMRQGRPVEAVRMYLKGHTLDPQAIAPIMRIGMILLGLRDRETAARWIDR